MSIISSKIESKYDIDDPGRTIEHRDLILSKRCLKRIYDDWYDALIEVSTNCPTGKKVEIGSGGGFFKDKFPELITSDILELPSVDIVVDAGKMPFKNEEVSCYFMVNVFHHLPDVKQFFREALRTLKKNGKIAMIEPANSPWSKLIYKNFHHELFDDKRDWSFPTTGPLSGSNIALPYIVFDRDRKIFEKEFPEFEIETVKLHGGFSYLFSGGVSRRQMMPDFMFGTIKKIENILPNLTGMFQTIVIRKL